MKRPFSIIAATVLAFSPIAPGLTFAADPADEIASITSSSFEASCHNQHDPALKEAIRKDVAAYISTLTKEWRRQTDFRIRAATTSMGKKIRQQNLSRSERNLNAVLIKLNAASEKLTADDIAVLDDLLGADPANEADVQAWSERAPSFINLDKVLNQLRLDLLRYANAADRKTITRVWAEKRNAFRADLLQQTEEARQLFINNLQNCYAGTSADETLDEAQEPEDATVENDDTSANKETTLKEEPKPMIPLPPTYDVTVNEVYMKVSSETGDASCAQRTVANAYIYANGRTRITGFFALEDGSRYPNVSFSTDDSGFVHARQILDYGTGTIAPDAGAVKFVVTSPTPMPSSLVPFKRHCESTSSSSPAKPVEVKENALPEKEKPASTDTKWINPNPEPLEQKPTESVPESKKVEPEKISQASFELLSVYVKVLPQMRSDKSCSEHLGAQVFFSGNSAGTVTGYLVLQDGTRSPTISVALDSSGFGELQQGLDPIASSNGGTVKFVATSPAGKVSAVASYPALCTIPAADQSLVTKTEPAKPANPDETTTSSSPNDKPSTDTDANIDSKK